MDPTEVKNNTLCISVCVCSCKYGTVRAKFFIYRVRTFLGSGDILAELNHEADGLSLEARYDFRLGLGSVFGCTKEWEINGN